MKALVILLAVFLIGCSSKRITERQIDEIVEPSRQVDSETFMLGKDKYQCAVNLQKANAKLVQCGNKAAETVQRAEHHKDQL